MQDDAEVFSSRRHLIRPPGGLGEILNIACDLGFDIPDAEAVWEQALLDRACAPEPQYLQLLRENADRQKLLLHHEETLERCEIHRNFGILTDKREIIKRSEAVGKATGALEMVLQHKELIAAHLQQPFAVNCIPVETEFQSAFAQVVEHAAADCNSIMASMEHMRWAESVTDPLSTWKEVLKPIPTLIAALSRYHEGLVALQSQTAKLEKAFLLSSPQHSISLEGGLAADRNDNNADTGGKAESEPASPRETVPLSFGKSRGGLGFQHVQGHQEERTPESHASVSFVTNPHPPQFLNTMSSTCRPHSPFDEMVNVMRSPEMDCRVTSDGVASKKYHGMKGGYNPSTPSVASSNSPQVAH